MPIVQLETILGGDQAKVAGGEDGKFVDIFLVARGPIFHDGQASLECGDRFVRTGEDGSCSAGLRALLTPPGTAKLG